ncbi:mitochondrial large subunit ribosomal protein-domain-containing protein [Camillea tinctor]|nr:mitochondrial large subunit ribosomal protein-domain-containing protein [Camillea tinctor]
MLLSRYFRPITRASAPLSTITPRFVIPAGARNLTTSEPTTTTTTTTTTDASLVAPPDAPLSEPPSEPISEPSKPVPPSLPYYVGRNNLRNFGVYQKKKRGGNFKVTLLKKAEGDLQALRRDVQDSLGLPENEVTVNRVTRHIEIRGHKRDEILAFLHTMGF